MVIRNLFNHALSLAFIVMISHLISSEGKTLRKMQNSLDLSLAEEPEFVFQGEIIEMKSKCKTNLMVQVRYYDGTLKHAISDNVRMSQSISVPTGGNVSLVLVGAESTDGRDIFDDKCAQGDRSYMRHDDGLCYKFQYSMEDNLIVCDDDHVYPPATSNGLRSHNSSTVIKVVDPKPR